MTAQKMWEITKKSSYQVAKYLQEKELKNWRTNDSERNA